MAQAHLGEEGFHHRANSENGIDIFALSITSPEGSKRFSRPIGDYLTLSFTEETIGALTDVLAKKLRELLVQTHTPVRRVLIVGLGNAAVTADAIGPETVDAIRVTGKLSDTDPCPSVFAIAPGVIGKTGIESFTLIQGARNATDATHIICIDALAAESTARLYHTLQLTTSGIVPGSGVGNHRLAISQDTLGVPVIAIGVPSVVSSATLVFRTLEAVGLGALNETIEETLRENEPYFVTPPDADRLNSLLSHVIASAIEDAIQKSKRTTI